MKSTYKLFALLAVLLASPAVTLATPVTVYIDITVEEVLGDSFGIYSANSVGVGSTYQGAFVYDDTATNISQGSSNFDEWNTLSVDLGMPFTFSSAQMQKAYWGPTSQWQLRSFQNNLVPGVSGEFRISTLGNYGYGAELGFGLGHLVGPPEILDAPIDFEFSYYDFSDFNNYQQTVTGSAVLSYTPSAVPAPASILFLLFGFFCLAGILRKRAGTA